MKFRMFLVHGFSTTDLGILTYAALRNGVVRPEVLPHIEIPPTS